MSILSEILSSKVRAEIFRILFDGTGKELHNRALQKKAMMSEFAIRKELHKLADLELLCSRKDGNRLCYSANREHPLYESIESLVVKSVGYKALLARALTLPEVALAFVFGSYAVGEARAESDIDLFVVGTIGLRAMSKILSDIESQVEREINVHIFTEEELQAKFASGDHFVTSIVNTEKEYLIGGDSDFRSMVQK